MPRKKKNTSPPKTIAEAKAAIQTPSEEMAPVAPVVALSPAYKPADRPVKWFRDESGLIPDKEYFFRPDGRVDWKRMIDPKYIEINKEYSDALEKKYGKPIDQIKPEEVQEEECLLIRLQGFKELAMLRGYESVEFSSPATFNDFVSRTCRITWIPNFETPKTFITEACADACDKNIIGWYKNYLSSAAENRAFVRCVKLALGIHILGKEEIGAKDTSQGLDDVENPASPHGMLKKILENRGITFEQFKNLMIKDNFEGAAEWETFKKIPANKILELIDKIQSIKL